MITDHYRPFDCSPTLKRHVSRIPRDTKRHVSLPWSLVYLLGYETPYIPSSYICIPYMRKKGTKATLDIQNSKRDKRKGCL